jgi:hypothetical protein
MNSTKHRRKIVTQSITMSKNNKEHRRTIKNTENNKEHRRTVKNTEAQ